VIGTDLYDRGGHFGQVKNLGPEFGADRIRDTPISEAAMVAAGVGAAMNGARPVVDLNFMDFAYGAMDEVVNQAAKMRYMWGRPVPLVIRGTAGVAQGGAQHNNSLQSWFMNTPGLAVVFPSRPWDSKGLIKSALRGEDPVIFMMHKLLTGVRGPVGDADELVRIGSARIVRPGKDVTVITYGHGVVLAEQAERTLHQHDIDVEIIDLRTLAPLDVETVLDSVRRIGRAIVLDEAPPLAGPAAAVVAAIQDGAFWYLDQPVVRITARHSPIPHSPVLMDALLPTAQQVVDAALSLARANGPQVLAG
jgi:pyruvate dehydrogenase E1 component beta subunit